MKKKQIKTMKELIPERAKKNVKNSTKATTTLSTIPLSYVNKLSFKKYGR